MIKKAIVFWLGGLFALGLASPVLGANLTGDPDTRVSHKIKPGALLLQAPADVVLPEVFITSEPQVTSTVAIDFLVEDNRGYKPPAGWSATVTMTKLVSAAAESEIPFVDSFENTNNYRLTPQNLASYRSATLEGIVLGAAEELIEDSGSGVSLTKTVMIANPGYGKGRLGCDIQIEVTISSEAVAAEDYTSTMTFTVS